MIYHSFSRASERMLRQKGSPMADCDTLLDAATLRMVGSCPERAITTSEPLGSYHRGPVMRRALQTPPAL